MWQNIHSSQGSFHIRVNFSRERSGDAPRRWYRAHNDPHAPKTSSAVTPPSPGSSSLNEPPEPSEGTPKVEGECLCHRRRHLISRPVKFTPLFCRPNDADQIWPSLGLRRGPNSKLTREPVCPMVYRVLSVSGSADQRPYAHCYGRRYASLGETEEQIHHFSSTIVEKKKHFPNFFFFFFFFFRNSPES